MLKKEKKNSDEYKISKSAFFLNQALTGQKYSEEKIIK